MPTRAATVLVVDDEEPICHLVADSLADLDCDCRTTCSSGEAMALLDAGKVDVLVADIRLRDLSGLDLLSHSRLHAPDCRVILISGANERDYLSQALVLGAFDYLPKPFDVDQLRESVSNALADDRNVPVLPTRAAAALEFDSRVRRASLDSVRALVRSVEAKDPYTRRHSEQVAHYAVHLAVELGLEEDEVKRIHTAALLHDVGKIGVPDRILSKSGPLTEAEFARVRQHPALGADILANITVFGLEARLVRYHHERWDGTGYPDGLQSTQAPLGARILQTADSIDAMLMDRTYKRGCAPEVLPARLAAGAGTQFDPDLASLAARWCRENPELLVTPARAAAVPLRV